MITIIYMGEHKLISIIFWAYCFGCVLMLPNTCLECCTLYNLDCLLVHFLVDLGF